ncbi:hypothetical protein [Nocardia sp. NPDC052112]|uniref:hypothetical protein n=1 Tax=Nocardia sp. NPDC052112 TaxID=3155646 RepID=UPI0034393748
MTKIPQLAIAADADEEFCQHDDGSWSLVGNDGWEVEFAEPDADFGDRGGYACADRH